MPFKDTMVDTVNLSTTDPTAAATAEATAAAASAAKFTAQATAPVATTATPELILGKYKSYADLEVAHKALEAKLGVPKVETPVVAPPAVTEPVKTPEALSIEAPKLVADAGFKMADLATEYSTHGDLTPETYAKLEKSGIGKDMVDAFVAGQKVLIEAETSAVMTKAGVTKESFDAMVKWAGANMSPDEIGAYNQAVAGTPAMKQFALEAMHNRFVRAQGSDPKLFTGERGVPTSDVYRSTQQMLSDMSNPLYAKDPAFRADVAAKVARSKLS